MFSWRDFEKQAYKIFFRWLRGMEKSDTIIWMHNHEVFIVNTIVRSLMRGEEPRPLPTLGAILAVIGK